MPRFISLFVWVCSAAMCAQPSLALAIEIGSKIGVFQPLQEVLGESRSLRSFSDKPVVFIFWSFKCPVSLAYDDRINGLKEKYDRKNVLVFGVASAANETREEIEANAANLKLTVPVLLDPEGNLAEMLGATHTPSVFVFDGDKILRYKGALDNNKKPGESGRIAYAENAIDAILEGRPVAVPETRTFGCSIRRK